MGTTRGLGASSLGMAGTLALLGMAVPARGSVDLAWGRAYASATVGDMITLDIYARSDTPEPVVIAGAVVLLEWDPEALTLLEARQSEPIHWLYLSFFRLSDPDGLNDTLEDGDAFLYALWVNGLPVPYATPEGLHIGSLDFEVVGPVDCTSINIPRQMGHYSVTSVSHGSIPGLSVLGVTDEARVTIGTCYPAGDFNDDCAIDAEDTVPLINHLTGPYVLPEADGCGYGDFDSDGDVDLIDIAAYQNAFGS